MEVAMRTSARRSRPTTTSLPAANVRTSPSYRTVRTGVAVGLIGTNTMTFLEGLSALEEGHSPG